MKIGILALQGAFREHENALSALGVQVTELRQKSHCNQDIDGLILPGGESTVMGKLLKELDMFDILKEKIKSGLPVFGTCAGLLLLAENIKNNNTDTHFGLMDITAVRNAYGRQLGSFETEEDFDGVKIPMSFIRAPYIESVGDKAQIMAKHKGKIVAAKQDNMLVTAFHPEVTNSLYVHKYFLEMCRK